MLSFGVKIAWFVLSLTGLLSNTIVLYAFGRAMGSQWGPMLFCFGNLLLQGMFCLGMIYRMDPFAMPRSFCLAQSILISFGADLLAGVTLAFSIATYLAVLKPKTWSDGPRALQWRNIYAIPIIAIPIIATAAQTAIVVSNEAYHPSDGMHCDSNYPQWPRMLGYAGIPFLMSLPSLYLSTTAILLIRKTNKHLRRARPDSLSDFKNYPRKVRARAVSFTHDISREPSRREAISPTITNSATSPRQYHLPFRPPSFQSVDERSKSNLSGRIESDRDDLSSRVSVTFPTFADPDPAAPTVAEEIRPDQEIPLPQVDGGVKEKKKWQDDLDLDVIRISDSVNDDSGYSIEDKADLDDEVNVDGVYAMYTTEHRGKAFNDVSSNGSPSSSPSRKQRKQYATLSPTIWWLILFQCVFIFVPILSSLSTFIDIVKKQSRPSPLGTQHFALLLAAWAPVVIFCHFPAVRRNLAPWRCAS